MPTPHDILNEIIFCRKQALVVAIKLGLITKRDSQRKKLECKSNPYKPKLSCVTKRMKSLTISDETTTMKMPDPRNIQLKDYFGKLQNNDIGEKSPYTVLHCSSGKKVIVRKTSLCWLMARETNKLSSDRLIRVQNPKKNIQRIKDM